MIKLIISEKGFLFMNRIEKCMKSKLTLEELEKIYHPQSYQELVDVVNQLISIGQLEPIVTRGENGKRPALYKAYWVRKEKDNYDQYREEVLFLDTRLSNDYYLKNLSKYVQDREYVQRLNRYYQKHSVVFDNPASYNERSFEIFYREKYLLKEGGIRVLNNLGLTLEELNCYETCEPLAYYSYSKHTPQTILIIENKDTYYKFRNQLLKSQPVIFGKEIGTVIYGGGKGIYRSFNDLHTSVEAYVSDLKNEILYFGDLDYEGIIIYETLVRQRKEKEQTKDLCIQPFVRAYEKMLEKAADIVLPITKEKQNRNINGEFFAFFSEGIKDEMRNLLLSDCYIPQEIIQMEDL